MVQVDLEVIVETSKRRRRTLDLGVGLNRLAEAPRVGDRSLKPRQTVQLPVSHLPLTSSHRCRAGSLSLEAGPRTGNRLMAASDPSQSPSKVCRSYTRQDRLSASPCRGGRFRVRGQLLLTFSPPTGWNRRPEPWPWRVSQSEYVLVTLEFPAKRDVRAALYLDLGDDERRRIPRGYEYWPGASLRQPIALGHEGRFVVLSAQCSLSLPIWIPSARPAARNRFAPSVR